MALGWGVPRFHDTISMFSNRTQFVISQTPYYVTDSGVTEYLTDDEVTDDDVTDNDVTE